MVGRCWENGFDLIQRIHESCMSSWAFHKYPTGHWTNDPWKWSGLPTSGLNIQTSLKIKTFRNHSKSLSANPCKLGEVSLIRSSTNILIHKNSLGQIETFPKEWPALLNKTPYSHRRRKRGRTQLLEALRLACPNLGSFDRSILSSSIGRR